MLALVFPVLLAGFAASVLAILWQSSVRDRYLRDPDLAGAEAVRRARVGGLLARGGLIIATVGLFVASAVLLGFRQYGGSSFVLVAAVGYIVAHLAPVFYFHLRNRAYLKAFWENAVLPRNSGRSTPNFVALRRVRPLANRVYALYLAEPMLCGAIQSGTTPLANRPGSRDYDPEFWTDQNMELLYDRIDVTTPVFLALHADNFQFAWRDIARIDYDKRTRRWRRWFTNSGQITIHPKNGRRLDFILAGLCDGEGLKALLDGILAAGVAKDLPVDDPPSGDGAVS